MTILFAADYIFDPDCEAFSGTKTGYGYMVKDILDELSKTHNIVLYTHKFSDAVSKNYRLIKHKAGDVIKGLRVKDCFSGLKYLTAKETLNKRLHYMFYHIDKGAFIKVLKDVHPDVVHIHGATISQKVFVDACDEMNIPYVVTLHGFNRDVETVAEADREYEYILLKKMQEKRIPVSVVSTGVKEAIIRDYGLTGENITVILNGIDTGNRAVRHHKDDGSYVIVSIGNVCERKNQLQLIRSLKYLPDEMKEKVRLIICGGNPENIDIDAEISSSEMGNAITYAGYVEREQLEKIWETADLNMVVSKVEGFGLSVIEGFLHGVPTLMFSDLDAVKDLYCEDALALIPARRDEDVAASIEECSRRNWDKDKIVAFGKRFSISETCRQYIKLYERALSR